MNTSIIKTAILSIVMALCARGEDLTHKFEASIFGGEVHYFPTSTDFGMYGGNFGYGFLPHTTAIVEVSHTFVGNGFSVTDSDVGFKYTLFSHGRVEPYALATAGVTQKPVGHASFVVHGGGGLRLYVGKRWGVQPEVRWSRYSANHRPEFGQQGTYAVRFSAGFFVQFGQ